MWTLSFWGKGALGRTATVLLPGSTSDCLKCLWAVQRLRNLSRVRHLTETWARIRRQVCLSPQLFHFCYSISPQIEKACGFFTEWKRVCRWRGPGRKDRWGWGLWDDQSEMTQPKKQGFKGSFYPGIFLRRPPGRERAPGGLDSLFHKGQCWDAKLCARKESGAESPASQYFQIIWMGNPGRRVSTVEFFFHDPSV